MPLIDAHLHFGPGLTDDRPFDALRPLSTVAEAIGEMDAAGIDRAVAFAPRWRGGAFVDPDYSKANAAIAAGISSHPSRIVGFIRIDPRFGARAVEQFEAGIAAGFQGLKLDPETEAFSPLDRGLLGPLFELCAAHGLPALVHTGFHPAQPLLWVELAKEFPDVPVILGHMGYRVVADAVIAAKRADNIFLETSGQQPSGLSGARRQVGASRMIFGTDMPFNDPKVEIRRLRAAKFSDTELDLVTGANILGLLPRGWVK